MALETTEDIEAILETLRESGFAWIADEIELRIGQGKEEEVEYREHGKRKPQTGTTTISYTPSEQEILLARTLRSYFVHIHDVWSSAKKRLARTLEITSVDLDLSRPGEEPKRDLFSDHYLEARGALGKLLERVDPSSSDEPQD